MYALMISHSPNAHVGNALCGFGHFCSYVIPCSRFRASKGAYGRENLPIICMD